MAELAIVNINNFENYISQLENNDTCFQAINNEINKYRKNECIFN